MPVRSRRRRISPGVAFSFAADARRSAARTGYQSRRSRSRRPAVSNGSIARSMRASRARRAEPRGAAAASRRTGRQFGTERRMRAEQESGRQLGPPEPARRFAEAGGREVEQAEPLEERRIVHRRVQRGDQAFGRVQLRERRLLVREEGRVTVATRRRALQEIDQAQDAEQGQRKAGREQRIDDAGGRRQERPRRPRNPRAAEREAGRVDERQHGARRAELIRDRRQRRPAAGSMPPRHRRRRARPRPDRSAPRRRSSGRC